MCHAPCTGLPRWLGLRIPLPTHGLQEKGVRSLGGEDPLEKEVATYASIPVWRGVLWTVEPGGL